MTLKELAKIAGVSASTVSKALNDSSEIGEKTKKKINELAKLYNYHPNNLAVNLKTGKTKAIGVVVPSIRNNFFAKAIMGIEEYLNEVNYNIIISISNESNAKEASIVKTLSNGVVDGFIIALAEETQLNQDVSHFQYASDKGKSIVMFDRVIEDSSYNKVIVDDKTLVYNAVKGFIENGKSSIALVSSIYNLSVGQSRKEGYLRAIENHQDAIIIEAEEHNLEQKLDAVLKSTKVDAIIALDEDASLFSLKVATNRKLNIPKDVSILGFAPSKFAKHLRPQLSTFNQHGKDIGGKSAQLLINKLNNSTIPNKSVVITSTINHRETT